MPYNILKSNGEELTILASTISIKLGQCYDIDELLTLSILLSSIASLIGLIVAQKQRESDSAKANNSNK